MVPTGEQQTVPCDWCGHVVAVAQLARFDTEEGHYKYACAGCAVRVDPHTMELRPSRDASDQEKP
jgi:hypothetical protein